MIQILTVTIPLAVALLAALQWLYQWRKDFDNKQFEKYHDLIKRLVKGDPEDKGIYELEGRVLPYIDRQVAIVFELRSFPKYFEVTYRILFDLKQYWSDEHEKGNISKFSLDRLLSEANTTLNYILKNQGNSSNVWSKEHWYKSDERFFLVIPAQQE